MANTPLPASFQRAVLRQFRRAYAILVTGLAGLSMIAVAWHWSLPKPHAIGFPFGQASLVLLGAALLINGLSFYSQDLYVRRLLKAPNNSPEFSTVPFALRFYGINLAIALLFSLLGFYPLLMLVFFFAYYPIVFWLLPYHLLMGFVLGGLIQQRLVQGR